MKPRFLALGLITLAASGCSHQVYSPPSRFVALQGPEAIGENVNAGAIELGTQGDIFGPSLVGVTARVRHGFTEATELTAEASLIHVDDSEAAETDQSPEIFAARVGTKWSPQSLGHHLAVTAGLGGGAHTGGGFVAPDVGLVVGYDNPNIVPFLGVESGVSLPINASAVDTSREDEEVGSHLDTPVTTFSVRTTLGIRVPVTMGWNQPGAFVVGVQHTWLRDIEGESAAWFGPGSHFEVNF